MRIDIKPNGDNEAAIRDAYKEQEQKNTEESYGNRAPEVLDALARGDGKAAMRILQEMNKRPKGTDFERLPVNSKVLEKPSSPAALAAIATLAEQWPQIDS